MQPKTATVIFIILFLVVQSQYFWGQNLGLIDFYLIMVSFYVFGIICIVWFYQLIKFRKRENRSNSRIATILLGVFVITSSYLKPYGLIDFHQFEPKTLLEAKKEGSGGCNVVLKLYEDYTFKECESCFGSSTTKGEWRLINDTFYFSKVRNGTRVDEYYEKGIIKKSTYNSSNASLIRFIDNNDSIGKTIRIIKNELE